MRSVVLLAVVASMGLAGCVAPPPRPMARPMRVAPAPMAEVVAYPAKGQTAEQLDRDRYECHNWAVKQTGFDPSAAGVAPQYRVRVVGPPPGSDVLAGGLVGAMIGATVSRPRDAGAGALLGAVTGAVIGAAADQSRQQAQERVEAQVAADNAAVSDRAGAYRRAISACLEGRGYTVK